MKTQNSNTNERVIFKTQKPSRAVIYKKKHGKWQDIRLRKIQPQITYVTRIYNQAMKKYLTLCKNSKKNHDEILYLKQYTDDLECQLSLLKTPEILLQLKNKVEKKSCEKMTSSLLDNFNLPISEYKPLTNKETEKISLFLDSLLSDDLSKKEKKKSQKKRN
jgi:hypothetical protein